MGLFTFNTPFPWAGNIYIYILKNKPKYMYQKFLRFLELNPRKIKKEKKLMVGQYY